MVKYVPYENFPLQSSSIQDILPPFPVVKNPDYKNLDIESLEEIFIKNFVKKLKISEIENIEKHCVDVLKNSNNLQSKVINFREKYISNIGHSIESAMDYLMNLKN